MIIKQIKEKFKSIFNEDPLVFSSPGRINIIGEHIDYNGGFVMPAAIDKAAYVAITVRDDNEVHLYADNFNERYVTSLVNLKKTELSWANYLIGVAEGLQKRGYQLKGFNLLLYGNVPLGAGLSSSAAIECATVKALQHINHLNIPNIELALIAQKAEHEFAGVNCGIMDQFASVFGKEGLAILLDCKTLAYEYIPLNLDGYQLILLNTNVKHSLNDSAYNERRNQCEQGIKWIQEKYPEVKHLRDVNQQMLDDLVLPHSKIVYQRCTYVVGEIERVKKAVIALNNGNLLQLGDLMLQTHDGLSNDYQVSCQELDFLVNQVRNEPEVLGARMMGGGFGGCTINIVKNEAIDGLVDRISKAYKNKFNLDLSYYIVNTGHGARLLD